MWPRVGTTHSITPVPCFTILSYVSRPRTTLAVYIIHPSFVQSCGPRGFPLAPGSLPAGFGPGGLSTGGIVSVVWAPAVSLRWSGPTGPIISDPATSSPTHTHLKGHSFCTCTNPQDHMLYHMYSAHHGSWIGRIQVFFFLFSLHRRRFSSPRCGEEFETDSVRKSCGKASTNCCESPQLTTPQHHDLNRWLPDYC
jgi:hypothetical protein